MICTLEFPSQLDAGRCVGQGQASLTWFVDPTLLGSKLSALGILHLSLDEISHDALQLWDLQT